MNVHCKSRNRKVETSQNFHRADKGKTQLKALGKSLTLGYTILIASEFQQKRVLL